MHDLFEMILGLPRGFLGREGEFSLQFNPTWPWQDTVGATLWNLLLALAAAWLVVHVYRREGRGIGARIVLGILRALLLAFLIVLLNRPTLTLEQVHREPSVVAVLVDDSMSMNVHDAAPAAGAPLAAGAAPIPSSASSVAASPFAAPFADAGKPPTRLQSAVDLLTGNDAQLLRALGREHTIKLYKFDRDAQELATVDGTAGENARAVDPSLPPALDAISNLRADGQSTQVIHSVRTVLDDLQSRRLAGVVLLTDGRDVPAEPLAKSLAGFKDFGASIYAVPLGSDKAPKNIAIESIDLEPSAFKDDYTSVKVTLRATGYEPNHLVTVLLKDKRTGLPLKNDDGTDVQKNVPVGQDEPTDVELEFKPRDIGTLDLIVEAVPQPGEVTEEDNFRTAQVAVLDAKITLLFVDGYPRWEYRYLKNAMLRDKTMTLSCLLTSADPSFAQEGTKPITRFPESIEELMQYDVVIFGDVDPREFTDNQLQLVSDFVSKKGGGFGMVAGPQWSPQAFRNTPIEPILPVGITHVETDDSRTAITEGFRPVLTRAGEESSIFRFFADRQRCEQYMKTGIQPLFWYCRGETVKPGVGEAIAEHPTDIGPDGRKAPILVLGRFGAGRTLFSAIDDSWRWRFYTGESVFDTYWVEQLRYLARSKKLGQRKLTFTSIQPAYELGEQVGLRARVLSPDLISQLPPQLPVELVNDAGAVVRTENLIRQDDEPDLYTVSFTADSIGHLTARLPKIVGDVDSLELPVDVTAPKLELADPQVDRTLLTTLGRTVELADARTELPKMIRSAAKNIPVDTSAPLWDAPLAMAIFVLLITSEWVLRKLFGMV
jgi:uncharacterized membrane protein